MHVPIPARTHEVGDEVPHVIVVKGREGALRPPVRYRHGVSSRNPGIFGEGGHRDPLVVGLEPDALFGEEVLETRMVDPVQRLAGRRW